MTAGPILHFRVLDNGCWEWHGPLLRGYGKATLDGVGQPAHRVVYMTLVGPIPDGYHLDHTCTNRACVNPAHLEPVTAAENNRRSWAARKTTDACRNGHPLIDSNIQMAGGRVRCKTCHRQYMRDYMRTRTDPPAPTPLTPEGAG